MNAHPHSTDADRSTTSTLDGSFEATWTELAAIGATRDSGYHRFAWTPVDLELRAWFRDQAERRSMAYEVDRNGNQWAWHGTPADGAVVTGSHLDSVRSGGAFDGPLGIVSAFSALDALREQGTELHRPIAVVNFVEEEGARFGVPCAGSRLLTGTLVPETARSLVDVDGTSMAEAMDRAGVDSHALGRDDAALARIGVYVELHIEQGRALTHRGAPVGVATAIWPHGRWRYAFSGEADHAGTTRLEDRHDPMLPFASTVLEARRLADAAGAVATFGRVRVDPNATNAIPALVEGWLDARAPEEDTLAGLVADLSTAARSYAEPHAVALEVVPESFSPVVNFQHELRDHVAKLLDHAPTLPTGAGHDAGILSAHVPSTMLFVRNHTGVSHSPAETADLGDCLAGVAALTRVLADLGSRPG